MPFTIRDLAPAAPLSSVPARDDPTRTQKLKGLLHPRPTPDKAAERQAKMVHRDLMPRFSSNVGGAQSEAGGGSRPTKNFAPIVSLDSDEGRPTSPHGGEHVPILELSQ